MRWLVPSAPEVIAVLAALALIALLIYGILLLRRFLTQRDRALALQEADSLRKTGTDRPAGGP